MAYRPEVEIGSMMRSIINNAPHNERARLRSNMNCRCCANHRKIKSNPSEDQLLADLAVDTCECECAENILRYVRMKTWCTPVIEIGIREHDIFNVKLNGLTGKNDHMMRCEDLTLNLKGIRREIEGGRNEDGMQEVVETPRRRLRRLISSSSRMVRSFSRVFTRRSRET